MRTLLVMLMITGSLISKEAQWELIWADEFNKPGTPDTSHWSFDTSGNAWDWGNNEKQNYTSENKKNAWVENGRLIIEARKERNTSTVDKETKEYSSARLRTKDKGDWIHGRYEIRAKLPKGVGTWPAIWMLPTDDAYGEWPNSGEIDIVEAIGSEPTTHYSTVWNSDTEAEYGDGDTTTLPGQGNKFHTYRMEWYTDSLLFFVDNKLIHKYRNKRSDFKQWPFDRRFHLLLNVAVGGDWEKKVNPESFPARMEVDYVRVYQKRYDSETESPVAVHGSVWMKKIPSGIEIHQKEGAFTSVELIDVSGKTVLQKELGFLGKGEHTIPLNKNGLSGEFTARVMTSDGSGEMKLKLQ